MRAGSISARRGHPVSVWVQVMFGTRTGVGAPVNADDGDVLEENEIERELCRRIPGQCLVSLHA